MELLIYYQLREEIFLTQVFNCNVHIDNVFFSLYAFIKSQNGGQVTHIYSSPYTLYADYAHKMHMHGMNKMLASYGLVSESQHEWSGQVTHVKLLLCSLLYL